MPGEARAVAEAVMRAAAPAKAHAADLVNVALEELVRHTERLELPAGMLEVAEGEHQIS